jgi:hypothetical protein
MNAEGGRRRSRVALVLAGLALVGLAGAVALALVRRHDKRAQALALIQPAEVSELTTAAAQLDAAEKALALDPTFEDAHAFHAFALARRGDLDGAHRELAQAGNGPRAMRARAWIEFREGDVDEGLKLIRRLDDWTADVAELSCASDRPFETVLPHGTGSAFWWEQFILIGDPDAVRRTLDDLIKDGPNTIEALTALRARARMEAFLFDGAAKDDLDRAASGPPHERALAEPDQRAIGRLLEGATDLEPVPPLRGAGDPSKQSVWAALADQVSTVALEELERDRLLDSNAALDRAERRLVRVCSLAPGRCVSLVLLARALERRPTSSPALLTAIAEKLSKCTPESQASERQRRLELARIALVQGRLDDARAALGDLSPDEKEDRLAVRLRAVLGQDAALAARSFGLDGLKGPEEAARVLHAALAFALDRPWDALEDMESLANAHPEVRAADLAAARAKTDPCGALLALVRGAERTAKEEGGSVAHFVGIALAADADPVDGRLQSRGFTPDEVKQGLALLVANR